MKKLISAKELGELLGVSVITLYRKRKEGMPFKQIGGLIRYNEDEVLKWFEEQQRTASK